MALSPEDQIIVNNQLFEAALAGDKDGIDAALLNGAQINAKDDNGNDALMLANWAEDRTKALETVKHLIENHSANLFVTNGVNCSAEIIAKVEAAKEGQSEKERGLNNQIYEYIKSAREAEKKLFDAASKGDVTSFETALTSGARLNAKNGEGLDVSLLAAQNCQIEMYDYVVAKEGFVSSGVDNSGNDALMLATWGRPADERSKNLEMIQHLVKNHSANLLFHENNFGESAYSIANEAAHPATDKLRGARQTEIIRARNNKIFDYIDNIIKSEVGLFVAAAAGDVEKFEAALAKGARLNAKNGEGLDASLLAAENGQYDMYVHIAKKENFVEGGKDINGNNALLLAAWGGHVDLFNKLVNDHGFDPKAVNNLGWNVANIAAYDGNVAMIKNIGSNHKTVDLNHKNNDGESPTLIAAKRMIETGDEDKYSEANYHIKDILKREAAKTSPRAAMARPLSAQQERAIATSTSAATR